MNNFKDFLAENKKTLAFSALGLLGGYYVMNRLSKKDPQDRWLMDPQFKVMNIPLHHTNAVLRDQMIEEGSVKYELIIVMSKSETYEGKVTLEFKLTDKNLGDLFLDFQGQSITRLEINDTIIAGQTITFNEHKIYLPKYNL